MSRVIILPPFKLINDKWRIYFRGMTVRPVTDGSRKRVGLW